MSTVVEVRCPHGPRRLFTKLHFGQETARITGENLLEFSCGDCARRIARHEHRAVRVYHRYDFLGEHIETDVVPTESHRDA